MDFNRICNFSKLYSDTRTYKTIVWLQYKSVWWYIEIDKQTKKALMLKTPKERAKWVVRNYHIDNRQFCVGDSFRDYLLKQIDEE